MDTRPRILAKFCELVEFSPTEAQSSVLRWMLAARDTEVDGHPVKSELLWLAGRGSGKSTLAVLAGLFAAGVGNAHVLLTSPSLDLSSSVLMGYARRHASPLRRWLCDPADKRTDFLHKSSTTRELKFRAGGMLKVVPAREGAVRGYGPTLVICDEVVSWPWTSCDGQDWPGFLDCLRPRMVAQFGREYRIVSITTPGVCAGPLYEAASRPHSELVVRANSTMSMRPNVSEDMFAHLQRSVYTREILAQFSSAEDSPLTLDMLERCTRPADEIPEPQGRCVLAVDQAFLKDCSGFAVLSRAHGGPTVCHYLARKRIRGDLSGLLPLLAALRAKYKPSQILLDQFSGQALCRWLSEHGISAQSIAWTIGNKNAAVDHLGLLLEDQAIILPESKELREEISGIRVSHAPGGTRRVEVRVKESHGDLLSALMLGCWNLRTVQRAELLI